MHLRSVIMALAIAVIPAVATTQTAYADKALFYTGAFSNTAVQGYDPVAYFTEGRPVKGSADYKTTYKGAEFRFSSVDNLASFEADPAKYAPQFGGYCAWAVSQGYTAKGDADHWAVVDGKLYLNYNKKIQDRWNADQARFIRQADTNWPSVLTQ